MFKVINMEKIKDMGFKKVGYDYVYRSKNSNGGISTIFTVYSGSCYIRYSKTSYVSQKQLECIYEWTKEGLIELEKI